MKEEQKVMRYKLMIKQHYETGVSYLCVTKRKKWKEYRGSGTRWNTLLNKYPQRILTILLFQSDDIDAFNAMCMYYSDQIDVVNNRDYANLVPEYGYDLNRRNFQMWWENLDKEAREKFVKNRTDKINAFYSSPAGVEARRVASERTKAYFSSAEGEEMKRHLSDKLKEYCETHPEEMALKAKKISDSLNNPTTKKLLQENQIARWQDPVYRENTQKSIQNARLNSQAEVKSLRAQRVRESFKTQEKRLKFVEQMSANRNGIDNPNARPISWKGMIFDTTAIFAEYLKSHGIPLKKELDIIKSGSDPEKFRLPSSAKNKDEITLTCPHCGFSKTVTNSQAFNRWHNDNCKMNPNRKENGNGNK